MDRTGPAAAAAGSKGPAGRVLAVVARMDRLEEGVRSSPCWVAAGSSHLLRQAGVVGTGRRRWAWAPRGSRSTRVGDRLVCRTFFFFCLSVWNWFVVRSLGCPGQIENCARSDDIDATSGCCRLLFEEGMEMTKVLRFRTENQSILFRLRVPQFP